MSDDKFHATIGTNKNSSKIQEEKEGHIVELPSQGIFYPNKKKHIIVNLLKIKHVEMLYTVVNNPDEYEKYERLVAVINSCIASEDIDAYSLTVDDFKYILYWLRINSFPRSPQAVSWEQNGKIENRIINESNLDLVILNESKKPLYAFLDYERTQDRIFALREKANLNDYIRDNFSFISGKNSEEKLENFRKLPVDYIIDIKMHRKTFFHGLNESVYVNSIEEDPNSEKIKISFEFDLNSFYP